MLKRSLIFVVCLLCISLIPVATSFAATASSPTKAIKKTILQKYPNAKSETITKARCELLTYGFTGRAYGCKNRFKENNGNSFSCRAKIFETLSVAGKKFKVKTLNCTKK